MAAADPQVGRIGVEQEWRVAKPRVGWNAPLADHTVDNRQIRHGIGFGGQFVRELGAPADP